MGSFSDAAQGQVAPSNREDLASSATNHDNILRAGVSGKIMNKVVELSRSSLVAIVKVHQTPLRIIIGFK